MTKNISRKALLQARKESQMARQAERRSNRNSKAFWALQGQYAFEEMDMENGKFVFNMAGELVMVA